MVLADKVARFYVQHDRNQVSCLNNERWNKILNNSSAWQKETKTLYNAVAKLPVSHATVAASASKRLMQRRRQRELAGVVVAVDSSATFGARALAQLMEGFTGAASWLISPQNQCRVIDMGKVAVRSLFASPLRAALGRSRLPAWLASDEDEPPLLPRTHPVAESADAETVPTPPRQETKSSVKKRSTPLRLATPPAPPTIFNASPIMLNARH